MPGMLSNLDLLRGRIALLVVLLVAAQPLAYAADKQAEKQRKANESEAKRLIGLGRTAEKQGRLLEARQQYLASEHVLFTADAEKGLEHIAEAAARQVKTLLADAERAYAAENFSKTAQLLETAATLHPGHLAIGCNLGLTRYQQGNRDDALTLLEQCVGAVRDKDSRRQLAELYTALGTGDRSSLIATAKARQQVARLNDAILQESDKDAPSDDLAPVAQPGPIVDLCGQMKQLQLDLAKNAAMLFNLAKCAESEGSFGEASRLLTAYSQAAPMATDTDEIQARQVVLEGLSALAAPSGTRVRALYVSAGKHVEARRYDQAIADYESADESLPD